MAGGLAALFCALACAEPSFAKTPDSCPANLALHEPGFDSDAIKMPFQHVLKSSLAQADLLFIGETSAHDDLRLANFMARAETMDTFARDHVRHFFVEMPRNVQNIADDLAAGKINQNEFTRRMLAANYHSNDPGATDAILRMMGNNIVNAAKNGIKLHFADFDNGGDEYSRYQEMAEYLQKMAAVGNVPESRLNKIADEVEALETAFNRARLDDRKMAEFINETVAPGEKAVVFYGAQHGSRFKDFEEYLKMPSLRLDLYTDTKTYAEAETLLQHDPQSRMMRVGEDKPEMVYILSDKDLFLTCRTPDGLKAHFEPQSLRP